MSQLLLDIVPAGIRPLIILWWGAILNCFRSCVMRWQVATASGVSICGARLGSGKSHLLQASVRAALADTRRRAIYAQGSVPQPADLVAVDDVECLDDGLQVELFDLYNRMRDSGGLMLVSGKKPALHLQLRNDLRTRLGWGLVYQVHCLSDEEKAQALVQHAHARGFVLRPGYSLFIAPRAS